MKPQIIRVPLTSRIQRPRSIERNADGDTFERRGPAGELLAASMRSPAPPPSPPSPPRQLIREPGMFLGKPAIVFISLVILFLIAIVCALLTVSGRYRIK